MGSTPSAPAAPDPTKTGKAQTASNEATALYQAQLNNVNQITPYGNETFTQTSGTPTYNYDAYNTALTAYNSQPQSSSSAKTWDPVGQQWVGSDSGSSGTAPKLSDYQTSAGGAPQFTSTISLSPQEQALFDSTTANQTQAAGLASTELGQAQTNLSNPYSLSGVSAIPANGDITAYQKQITDAINSRLQPQLDHSQELLDTKLANQGVVQGSDAYNKAQTLNSQAQNDAYQQSILSGVSAGDTMFNEGLQAHDQGVSDYNQQYYAPLNAYNELENGVSVQNPQFAGSGNTSVAPTNTAQIAQNAYQGALNNYNQQVASSNSTNSALFGLAGNAASGFLGSTAGASWLAALL